MGNDLHDEDPLYELEHSEEPAAQETAEPAYEQLDAVEPDDVPDTATLAQPSPLSGLNLALTVRCGDVNLSLEALGRLAAGSVVQVMGMAPGEATLCHEERVVAYGELVDVDGRLGMQITRLVFDQ